MSILTDARKFVGTAIIETEGSFYVWKTFFTFWSFSCLEEKWASVLHKKQSITKKNPKFSSNIYNKGIIRSTNNWTELSSVIQNKYIEIKDWIENNNF